MTNKMQQCRIIYCSLAALHVSSDIFAHDQEHLNCIYSRPATAHVYNTRSCKYSLDAPDDERKYHSKHVEQPRYNKLAYTLGDSSPLCSMYMCCLHATIHPPTAIYKWRQNCSQHWEFVIFAILYFYNFILFIDTAVQNNNNEISLYFKPMRLIFKNYSV
jgi:hypothetical protein